MKTQTQPTAAAVRAAEKIRAVYCDKPPTPREIERAAEVIDRETALPQLLEACEWAEAHALPLDVRKKLRAALNLAKGE